MGNVRYFKWLFFFNNSKNVTTSRWGWESLKLTHSPLQVKLGKNQLIKRQGRRFISLCLIFSSPWDIGVWIFYYVALSVIRVSQRPTIKCLLDHKMSPDCRDLSQPERRGAGELKLIDLLLWWVFQCVCGHSAQLLITCYQDVQVCSWVCVCSRPTSVITADQPAANHSAENDLSPYTYSYTAMRRRSEREGESLSLKWVKQWKTSFKKEAV